MAVSTIETKKLDPRIEQLLQLILEARRGRVQAGIAQNADLLRPTAQAIMRDADLGWAELPKADLSYCQFSPIMGPSVFGQGGRLPEVTMASLLA